MINKSVFLTVFLFLCLLISAGCDIRDFNKSQERTYIKEKYGDGKKKIVLRYRKRDKKEILCEKVLFDRSGRPVEVHNYLTETVKYLKFFKDGSREKQEFKNGKKSGLWIYWDSSGALKKKGTYRENLKHGKWRFWDKEGNLKRILIFREGSLIKTTEK